MIRFLSIGDDNSDTGVASGFLIHLGGVKSSGSSVHLIYSMISIHCTYIYFVWLVLVPASLPKQWPILYPLTLLTPSGKHLVILLIHWKKGRLPLRDGQNYAMHLLEFLNCWQALLSCYTMLSVRKARISNTYLFFKLNLKCIEAVAPHVALCHYKVPRPIEPLWSISPLV